MKNFLGLLICIAIGLILMAGCGEDTNRSLSRGAEKNTGETPSSSSAEITDWKPTMYEVVNDLDGVVMTAKEGTISSTGLTVAFENNSNKQCIYGEYFCLEKNLNGAWYQVPVAIDGSYGFDDIGYNLDAGNDRETTVDWEWLYGSLKSGEYRLVKDVLDFRTTGEYDTYYLAAEFTVS